MIIPDLKGGQYRVLYDHMTLGVHECWTEKEIEDTLKAFKKVEKVYSI